MLFFLLSTLVSDLLIMATQTCNSCQDWPAIGPRAFFSNLCESVAEDFDAASTEEGIQGEKHLERNADESRFWTEEPKCVKGKA